jgi:HSP20 family protein
MDAWMRRRGASAIVATRMRDMNLPFLSIGKRRNEVARSEDNLFAALQSEIDRVFSDFSRGWPTLSGIDLARKLNLPNVDFPRMDLKEKNGSIEITAELPGLEEKDVEVTLVDNVLTLKGEKKAEKEEKDENRYVMERSYGAFSRSIELPEGVKPEDVKASMAKGVLTVTLPKPQEAKPDAKKIEIQAAA